MKDSERDQWKQFLRSLDEQTLDERLDRYLSVKHQWVTADHHFALPSAECIHLYRDGYFFSCVMLTQSVAEGIARFIAQRNSIAPQQGEKKLDVLRRMEQVGIVSTAFVEALARIQDSFRNDFHHMQSPVRSVDLSAIAQRNVVDLALLEREVFECSWNAEGALVPKHRQYWDIAPDGMAPVYVRLT